MNVVVIGAGVIGAAVAHELAARGAGVRLLDMRDVGQGATRASAGVLCPHIEGHAAPLLALGTRSLDLYDEFIAHVSHDAHRQVEYRRTGTLEVALTADEAVRLRDLAARHARGGVEHRYLDARQVLELDPGLSSQAMGGLFVPAHGYVGVQVLTDALAAAAVNRGARLEPTSRVRQIGASGGGVRVETADASIHADAAVLAAGSWSGTITIGPAPAPVRPIRGQLLHLRAPERLASRVIWGANCYLVPWQDGSLLVGATAEDVGFDEGATVAGVRDLLEYACELLPAAWTARFEGVRVGLRPVTPDEMPVIGASGHVPGVFYATGHYRNGVLLAPITARLIADLILEGRSAPELALTRPDRFAL